MYTLEVVGIVHIAGPGCCKPDVEGTLGAGIIVGRPAPRSNLKWINYDTILSCTLSTRGTFKAVTVICCRQAGRQARPDWTATLLIYR